MLCHMLRLRDSWPIRFNDEITGYDIGMHCPVLVVMDQIHLHTDFNMLHLVENLCIDCAVVSGNAVIAANWTCSGKMSCCLCSSQPSPYPLTDAHTDVTSELTLHFKWTPHTFQPWGGRESQVVPLLSVPHSPEGMSLICTDFCSILVEAVMLFVVRPHNFFEHRHINPILAFFFLSSLLTIEQLLCCSIYS